MNIAKLDLYNPEWLELVFDSKNKDYGAYELRQHYAGTLVKSMAIAFFSVAVLYTGYSILRPKTEISDPIIHVYTMKSPPIIKKEEVIPPKTQTTKPPAQVATIKYPVMVPKDDKDAENPPKMIELEGKAISTEIKSGNSEGVNIDIPESGSGSDMGAVTEHKDDVYTTGTIEVEPEPYGGAAAWAKFLQKNMHYPPQASENGVHGKVFLSFIVETVGHLSNIKVERGVGSGLDEEALRVLKIAPAWKPGIQNGHKVRVMYNIPINFILPDEN